VYKGGLSHGGKAHETNHISETKNAWGIHDGLLWDMDVVSCNGLVGTTICNLCTVIIVPMIRPSSVKHIVDLLNRSAYCLILSSQYLYKMNSKISRLMPQHYHTFLIGIFHLLSPNGRTYVSRQLPVS
jgi:hypothetical protein